MIQLRRERPSLTLPTATARRTLSRYSTAPLGTGPLATVPVLLPLAPRWLTFAVLLGLMVHVAGGVLVAVVLLEGHWWSGLSLVVGEGIWCAAECLLWGLWLRGSQRNVRLPALMRSARRTALALLALGALTGSVVDLSMAAVNPTAHRLLALLTIPVTSFVPTRVVQSPSGGRLGTAAFAAGSMEVALGTPRGVAVQGVAGKQPGREYTIPTPPGATSTTQSIAWSPDLRAIAASYVLHTVVMGSTFGVIVWESATGVVRYNVPTNGALPELRWSPDSTILAGYTPPAAPQGLGAVLRWDGATGQLGAPLFLAGLSPQTNLQQVFAWAPDSSEIAYIDNGQAIVLMDVVQEQVINRIVDTQPVLALDWSPNGGYVATGHADGSVAVWDVASQARVALLTSPLASVHALAWSPSSADVLAAGGDHVTILRVANHQILQTFSRTTNQVVTHPTLFPQRFLSAGFLAPDETLPPPVPASIVQSVAWSANNQTISALFANGDLMIWESTGQS